VGGIRPFIDELPAALVVKIEHELPVAPERLGAADIHDIIPAVPQPSRVAEGTDPRFCRNTRTRKKYNMAHMLFVLSLKPFR